jgi:hypothetical protein
VKVITEITFGDLAAGHVVLDPGGAEWLVDETKQGYVGPTIMFAAKILRRGQALWIQGTFSEPIAVVDQTTGDSVETVGRLLGGHIVMEPISGGPKILRHKLAGHLRIHHGIGVTGDKTMGTLAELVALHAAQHTPVSVSGIPHVHKELS